MFPKVIGLAIVVPFLIAAPAPASDAVDYAAGFIGRPYVWGAEGPGSFDCSGLTQYVYGQFDVDLPRRAVSQSKVGKQVRSRPQRGDLLFFASDTRKSLVTHVGIYEGDGRMIEASKSAGRVRRSDVDDDYWVERFMFARRVMPDAGRAATTRDRRAENEGDGKAPAVRKEMKRVAIRALEQLAGTLLRRPR